MLRSQVSPRRRPCPPLTAAVGGGAWRTSVLEVVVRGTRCLNASGSSLNSARRAPKPRLDRIHRPGRRNSEYFACPAAVAPPSIWSDHAAIARAVDGLTSGAQDGGTRCDLLELRAPESPRRWRLMNVSHLSVRRREVHSRLCRDSQSRRCRFPPRRWAADVAPMRFRPARSCVAGGVEPACSPAAGGHRE